MIEYLKDLLAKLKADLSRAHRSWTIWFNGIGGIAALLPMAQDQFPQLQDYLPANLYHYAAGVLVVGNILLRFKTTKALADK